MSNFTATVTAKAIRIHRDTCKKVRNGVELESLTDTQLLDSLPASCCKPSARGVEVARDEIIDGRETAARYPVSDNTLFDAMPAELDTDLDTEESDPAEVAAAEEAADDVQPEQDADDDAVTLVVHFDTFGGVAKHYWKALLRNGGLAVAQRIAPRSTATAKALHLVGTGEQVVDAEAEVRDMVLGVYQDFSTWRKTDAEYIAVKKADAGHHWSGSKRAVAELAYLEATAKQWGEQ